MSTCKKAENFIKILITFAIVCVLHVEAAEREVNSSVDLDWISRDFIDSRLSQTTRSETWWKNLSLAIDEFVQEYKLQHGKSVQVNGRLKRKDSAAYYDRKDDYCLSSILEFSYTKDDDRVEGSVIVDIPDLGSTYTFGSKMSLYAKEKYMYQEVFPLMYQSWPHEKFSPNFYASKESEILIIENLHKSDYFTKNSLADSIEECKLVLKSLAQFHALSIARLNDVQYSVLRSLTPIEIFGNTGVVIRDEVENAISYKEQLLSSALPSNVKEEITRMYENYGSIITLSYSPDANFNVILHGSLKPKSIFCKREGESLNLTGCKFSDFRLSRQGSPVHDLVNYLMGCVEFQVFKIHQNSLFTFYLEKLHETLAELNSTSQYDLNDLQHDLRRYKQSFIMHAVYQMPVIRAYRNSAGILNINEIYRETLQSAKDLTDLKNLIEVFLSW